MSKLKVAVIGVGNMGHLHLRAYNKIPHVQLSAIADTDKNLVIAVAQEYNTKHYEDYQELINVEAPDIVSICVPTSLHFSVAKECINRGIDVLLEKPITDNLSQAKELLELAKENKVNLLVGHIERYNPAVKKVKEIIERDELGKIINIIVRRVGGFPAQIKDANIAVDLAIHDIDVVNFLLKSLPTEIYVNKQRNHIERREDSVEFFLKYNNISAFIQANWITPVKIRKLTITGTEGYLEMDYINQQIEFYKSNYEKLKENIADYSDYILRFFEPDKILISVAKKEPLMEEISYFINCKMQNISVDSSFALDALKIALQ